MSDIRKDLELFAAYTANEENARLNATLALRRVADQAETLWGGSEWRRLLQENASLFIKEVQKKLSE